MAIPVRLVGSSDTSGVLQDVEVGTRRFLQVAIREGDPPPPGELSRYRYYARFLGSSGSVTTATDGGASDMGVNGAVTPQEFYIASEEDFDIRIMRIAITIADTAVQHNSFGNVSALTNGWDLIVREGGVETAIINKAKTGGRVIAQAGYPSPYGDTTTSWELSNWTATEDAQTVAIDMGSLVPGGLRIGRGTQDRLISRVNDDLTGLTEFYVRVIGYAHYP